MLRRCLSAGRKEIYVNKFRIMRILLYSEILLPDSPSSTDQPKTRSEDNLSEKGKAKKRAVWNFLLFLSGLFYCHLLHVLARFSLNGTYY